MLVLFMFFFHSYTCTQNATGITALELLLAHIITQTSIMLLQCIEIILLATFVFDVQNQGSNVTVVGLLMLLGFAGMLYGK